MTEEKKTTDVKVTSVKQMNEAKPVSASERDKVLAEFHETHRVPVGYVYNATWPDKVRKVG